MRISIGKRLALFLNSFLLLQSFFLVKNAKIYFFKEKMVLREVFIKLMFRWLQTGLSDNKNTKRLKFCLWWIFNPFLKRCILQNFSRFLKFISISWQYC